MGNWIKTSPYGDYKDPLQNHKFDDQLVFNTKTHKIEVYNRIKNILHEAKWHYGKHIGSKKLHNIMVFNRRANGTRYIAKRLVNSSQATEQTNK